MATQEVPGLNVLLVEDDRDGRRLYADWLAEAGFRVTQAHNGLQALEQALEAVPDIVVTDLNIPGIDGFEQTAPAARPHVLRADHRDHRLCCLCG